METVNNNFRGNSYKLNINSNINNDTQLFNSIQMINYSCRIV